jgi:hypothetical protein
MTQSIFTKPKSCEKITVETKMATDITAQMISAVVTV